MAKNGRLIRVSVSAAFFIMEENGRLAGFGLTETATIDPRLSWCVCPTLGKSK